MHPFGVKSVRFIWLRSPSQMIREGVGGWGSKKGINMIQ